MQAIDILHKVVNRQDLHRDEARAFLGFVMRGEVSPVVLSAFLAAMRVKVETGDEILGFVHAMKNNAITPKSTNWTEDVIDTCGTGGDGKGSINVSTLSALTLASLGIKVAKHGNRSVSSVSGSSDLLSSLGYPIEQSHAEVEESLRKKGFAFIFAPSWHPAMKHAAPVRKELGFRTFFNLIGPLSNPFQPTHQVVGVFSNEWIEKIAYCLDKLGLKAGIVCHSRDGLDEFSVFAPTDYILLKDGKTQMQEFHPETLKIAYPLKPEEIYVSTSNKAIELSKNILMGIESTGSHIVALNSGVALWILKKVDSIASGYKMALEQLLNKKVAEYTKGVLNLNI